jgi:hypothetical protein
MKTTSIAVLAALAGILGCNTAQQVEQRQAVAAPPAQVQVPLPPPSSDDLPEVFKGKPCQLGKSCLALDPRPFEICLLGTRKRCGDKMAEMMQVENAAGDNR